MNKNRTFDIIVQITISIKIHNAYVIEIAYDIHGATVCILGQPNFFQ